VIPTDKLIELPDDSDALQAMVRVLLLERDREKHRAVEQQQRADDLHIENLRLRVELDRHKKWYYGPRADRLQSAANLAQMLLGFAEALDRKPVNPDDIPPHAKPDEELRRGGRRKGRQRRQFDLYSCLPPNPQPAFVSSLRKWFMKIRSGEKSESPMSSG
jgi:hypothetical protein